MSYQDDDPVFQDGGKWYFWDESGDRFLGPFPDEGYARQGIEEYERYLATGDFSGFLLGTVWHRKPRGGSRG